MLSKKYLKTAFVAACIIESLCATYFLEIENAASFVSIIYFIAGISVGILILFFPQYTKNISISQRKYDAEFLFKILLIAGVAFFLFYESKNLFEENPIDYRNADMLPVIKTMNERFLNGQWKHVYDNIPGIWDGSKPIYLPFMWLPFSPAVAINFDARWITVAALFIVFIILINAFQFKKNKTFSFIILISSLAVLYWLFWQDDTPGFISLTEEGVIVLFYVLLALALATENIFLISITVCLCMLSRYSAIGFVPAFFIYLLLCKKNKQAFLFVLIGVIFVLGFFIIPFGWKPFTELIKLPSSYINFSKIVWKDTPEVFTSSLGFARFFIPEKINVLHYLLIALTLTVPAGFILFCHSFRKKIHLNNMPLATMKISLVVFYSFIDVPYLYLFYTSTLVSLVIAMYFLRRDLS
ncbi:MAG TPA: hypothetical protein VIH86_01495 [Puia sp.]